MTNTKRNADYPHSTISTATASIHMNGVSSSSYQEEQQSRKKQQQVYGKAATTEARNPPTFPT
eukprot:2684120-Ditylum_brightwellii.AAC.1